MASGFVKEMFSGKDLRNIIVGNICRSSKIKIGLPFNSANPPKGVPKRIQSRNLKKNLYTHNYSNIIHNSKQNWKHPENLSPDEWI